MEPRIDSRWRVPLPVYRRLRVFASDPGTTARYDTALANETTLLVPWEDLTPGPIGEYVAVVDKDDKGEAMHAPVDLNDAVVVAQDGLPPSDGNPQFHHQMVYAVAMRTIRNFERGLGRRIHWSPQSDATAGQAQVDYRQRLEIYPHFLPEANAYYDGTEGALRLGYFRARPESPFPGTVVYTCLSQDVIAHEITHAILGGMDISFKGMEPDAFALHEGYADLIAMLQHFWPSDVFRHQIAEVRGKLENSLQLGSIALQFGQGLGTPAGLRNAFGSFDKDGVWKPRSPDSKAYSQTVEPHERGAIMVSAVFEAVKKLYEARTADLRRIASKGTGVLPEGNLHPDLVNRLAREASRCAQRVLEMVIRALDYMPPVETTFGDFLRAIITADYDIRPTDDGNYRLSGLVDAFRSYGIVPSDVGTLSQDTLLWRPPKDSDGARAVSDFVSKLATEITPWSINRDRKERWALLRAQREQLCAHLTARMVKSIGPLDLTKPFAVESFQPRERIGAHGDLAFEWVIKLVQEQPRGRTRGTDKAVEMGNFDHRPWAGVTLIVNGDDGTIRYQIERKTVNSKPKDAKRPPSLEAPPIAPPMYRHFRVFAFDPSMGRARDTIGLNEALVRVPWELAKNGHGQPGPGPVGEYIEVIDRDPASQSYYEPVDLNSVELMAQHGLPPSESNPQFHQQMVYAVAMRTIRTFERALGRLALWRSHLKRDDNGKVVGDEKYVQRLRIYPHALREPNAYYSPDKIALLFGYFSAPAGEGTSARLTVFSCLSHDIIAHECTHALLDGMHRRFNEPSNPDVLAFHEAFADIVALFQHFSLPDVLRQQIASTRGDLAGQSQLGQLAQEFGQAIGNRGALRSAIGEDKDGEWKRNEGNPDDYQRSTEPHKRGAVLVAGVFDSFLSIYKGRVADLFRIATEGTGVLPEGSLHPDLVDRLAVEASESARQVLDMCIRALDYCPPIDITFGDYLRALVTADFENDPVDDEGRRVAFIEAFRRRGIVPDNVQAFSVDGLLWRPASGAPDEDAEVVVDIVKGWASEITSWGLSRDRQALFELTRQRRISLHAHLKSKMRKDTVVLAGIDPDLPFEVHSLRPSMRMDWEGRPSFQWVIELTQRIAQFVDDDSKRKDRPDYYFRGGCTLLVDAETGRVRYSIKKKLNDERKQRQRRFFVDEGSRSLAATYFGSADPEEREPFAILHRH